MYIESGHWKFMFKTRAQHHWLGQYISIGPPADQTGTQIAA